MSETGISETEDSNPAVSSTISSNIASKLASSEKSKESPSKLSICLVGSAFVFRTKSSSKDNWISIGGSFMISFLTFFSFGINASTEIPPSSLSKNESSDISPSPNSERSMLSVEDESSKKESSDISPSPKEGSSLIKAETSGSTAATSGTSI